MTRFCCKTLWSPSGCCDYITKLLIVYLLLFFNELLKEQEYKCSVQHVMGKHRPRPQFGRHEYTNKHFVTHMRTRAHTIQNKASPNIVRCSISSPAGILWRTMFAQSDGVISDLGECLELWEAASWSPALSPRGDAATASSSSQAENYSSAAVMSSRHCRCSLYIWISARTQRCAHPKALESQRAAEDEWIRTLTPETRRERAAGDGWVAKPLQLTPTVLLLLLDSYFLFGLSASSRPGKSRSNNANIIWLWIRRRWDSSCIEV